MSASDKIFGWRARASEPGTTVASTVADSAPAFTSSLVLESDLRKAFVRNQFELHYQPQLDLRSGDILSFEALLRWRHPVKGLLPASTFLAFAEQRNLMQDLDEWVLNSAIEQVHAVDRSGLPPYGVAINISRTQFHRAGFAERLEQLLRENRVPPTRIEIEITEDVLVGDTSTSIHILEHLHDLGVGLAIDDFGSGYSSLSYLRRLPIDELKIDHSFVSHMTTDESAAGVVRSIVELARSLKFQAVAEGLETSKQLRMLMNLRCERAQGSLIGRPMPATQLAEFLDEWPRRWQTLIN